MDTPRILRTNVKKCIDEVLNKEDDDDFDESEDDSCYSDSDEEQGLVIENKSLVTPKKETVTEIKKGRRVAKEVYCLLIILEQFKSCAQVKTFSADDYFDAHVSFKVMTSNHSLKRLAKPQLDQDTIQSALKKAPKKHQEVNFTCVEIFLVDISIYL